MLIPSPKSVSIPLGLTAAAAATDAAIQKKLFWSGMRLLDLGKGTTLTVSNEEMDDILTQWWYLDYSETIQNEYKEKNMDFSACHSVQ